MKLFAQGKLNICLRSGASSLRAFFSLISGFFTTFNKNGYLVCKEFKGSVISKGEGNAAAHKAKVFSEICPALIKTACNARFMKKHYKLISKINVE